MKDASHFLPLGPVPAGLPHLVLPAVATASLQSGWNHLLADAAAPTPNLQPLTEAAASLLGEVCPELVLFAAAFRETGGPPAVVIDGLPVETHTTESTTLAELASLAVARIFGEPFGFRQKKGGQVVFPLRTRAGFEGAINTSFGSGHFGAHTDNAGFAPDHCGDAALLLGVRNDAGVPTSLVPLARLLPRLPAPLFQTLQEPRFVHPITAGFAFRMTVATRPAPVLRRDRHGEWQVAMSAAGCQPAASSDTTAAQALQHFQALANDPALADPVVIGPGRALLLSNRRGLHLRASFRGERLVLRTYVAWDLDPFRRKTGEPGPSFDAWELLR